jgi:peptide deformylase
LIAVAVLQVLVYPDERLLQVSQPVGTFDATLTGFLADLEETMDAGPSSVGIAAPQVAHFRRIVLVDVSSMLRARPKLKSSNHGRMALINPEIVERFGEVIGREGCLSVPDYTGNVARAERIRLKARAPDGSKIDLLCEGFEARAIQHEIDHLDGKLFLERVLSPRELFRRKTYR